ncbi:MAG: TonB-dependent receptor [Vicinamibacterales bacterium]|nr:TonB-dependent receptor [Vicinamibacterales bacterium]
MQRRLAFVVLVLGGLLFLPTSLLAQSQFNGQARDESGAVLPGVTVEAASPVLIEKVKTAVTDDQGRYAIVDLRPGTYKVTFALTGFASVVRDAVELPANFIATINVEMKVGALEETVIVTGQTPLVDVSQASRTQVVTRDVLDTLPTTRHIFSVSNMLPGIRFVTPDIGGSRQMEQTNPRGHGVSGAQAQEAIDGMSTASQESNIVWTYVNDSLVQEVSITTAAQPAEVQAGSMRMNIIPKDGGNVFSGSVFLGGSDGSWQASNIDDYLRSQNITRGNGIAHIQTFNASLGGPVARNRLWFFLTARHASTDEVVANVGETIVTPQGEQLKSTIDQYIRDALGRLTWQMAEKHKLAAFFNRTWKRKGKDFGAGSDPRAGSYRDPRTGHYAVGQIKYTSTLTSRWLLEAGYSSPINHITIDNEPGISLPRYLASGAVNPAWVANARRTDSANNINPRCAIAIGCRAWVSNGQDQRTIATGHRTVGAASYVTGSHMLKVGIDRSFGWARVYTERQADLVQNYTNNRATSVTVFSTPGARDVYVNHDLGYYAQDSWHLKRLTLNLGLRVDNFQSMYEASANPAGRFVPARYFPERRNIPNWNNDFAPRLSFGYDVFGNGRTAVKGSWSKYYERLTGGFANNYAPGVQSESRNWSDCDLVAGTSTCSSIVLPTNGDDIAQLNEIGPSGTTNFGLTVGDRDMDPNIQRQGNQEITITGSHQLFPRVSITAGWYHRTFQDIQITDRTLIATGDYTSFITPMPDVSRDPEAAAAIDTSQPLTAYNLVPAKRSVFNTALVDKNLHDQSIYSGVDVSFQARLIAGSTLFGSWTTERNLSVFCSSNDNPNGPPLADLYTGASVSAGGRYCDQRQFDVPFVHEFKLAGNYPVPHVGLDVGVILQSYAGLARTITYQPAAGVFPGGARTNTETIILNEPGSLYYPRYNQLDLNFKKNFRFGTKSFSGQIDFFNVLNGNAIFARQDTVGNALGDVTTILQGRLTRLAFQMRF